MDTNILRESRIFRILNLLGLSAITILLVVLVINGHFSILIIFIAVLALWNLSFLKKPSSKIEYDNQGITIKNTLGSPVTFHWEDIELVDDRLMVGDIGIFEKTNREPLVLDASYKEIIQFYDDIYKKRPNLFEVSIGRSIRPNILRFQLALTIISIFSLILIFLLYQSNSIWLALVLGFVILAAVKDFLWSVRELTFEKDKIVLKSWVKTFEYELQNIKTIDFDPFLILEQKDGNLAEINLFGYSNFILYLQLHAWLETQKPPAGR